MTRPKAAQENDSDADRARRERARRTVARLFAETEAADARFRF